MRPDVDHSPPSRVRLRMSGAAPLFPIYAFMAWTETNLPFCHFPVNIYLPKNYKE
jgi:hypothetical protein